MAVRSKRPFVDLEEQHKNDPAFILSRECTPYSSCRNLIYDGRQSYALLRGTLCRAGLWEEKTTQTVILDPLSDLLIRSHLLSVHKPLFAATKADMACENCHKRKLKCDGRGANCLKPTSTATTPHPQVHSKTNGAAGLIPFPVSLVTCRFCYNNGVIGPSLFGAPITNIGSTNLQTIPGTWIQYLSPSLRSTPRNCLC
jgi:hypothetical protein